MALQHLKQINAPKLNFLSALICRSADNVGTAASSVFNMLLSCDSIIPVHINLSSIDTCEKCVVDQGMLVISYQLGNPENDRAPYKDPQALWQFCSLLFPNVLKVPKDDLVEYSNNMFMACGADQ